MCIFLLLLLLLVPHTLSVQPTFIFLGMTRNKGCFFVVVFFWGEERGLAP